MVCPLYQLVTLYLTMHLQRVHKLTNGSDAYNEAIQNKRRYLGRKKVPGKKKKVPGKKLHVFKQDSRMSSQKWAEPREIPHLKINNRLQEKPHYRSWLRRPTYPMAVMASVTVPPTPPPVTEEENSVALCIIEPTQELSGENSRGLRRRGRG